MSVKPTSLITVFIATFLFSCSSCSGAKVPEPRTWQEIVPEALESTVMIKVTSSELVGPIESDEVCTEFEEKLEAVGTGFVISPDGYVMTNFHVIFPQVFEEGSNIWVEFANGTRFLTHKVKAYPKHDLAILKINAYGLRPMQLETERKIKIGDPVLSIGNSYPFTFSVTSGIISHKSRELTDFPFEFKWTQMTAHIYPGFSGGPVLNEYGKLIGVNHAISPKHPGFGLIIPVSTVVDIINNFQKQLIKESSQE